jgi:uncharacterized membrane protein YkvA (DUF1232 family)
MQAAMYLLSAQGLYALWYLFRSSFKFAFMVIYLISPIDLIPEV